MKHYFVYLGSGRREVFAACPLEAVTKATGRPADRFTQTAPGVFKETACNPGHQGVYGVKLAAKF